MSNASMTFGRQARLTMPRGAVLFANLAFALINGARRVDRWLLSRRPDGPTTPEEVMAYARQFEKTDPGYAADLRAAAMRASGD